MHTITNDQLNALLDWEEAADNWETHAEKCAGCKTFQGRVERCGRGEALQLTAIHTGNLARRAIADIARAMTRTAEAGSEKPANRELIGQRSPEEAVNARTTHSPGVRPPKT